MASSPPPWSPVTWPDVAVLRVGAEQHLEPSIVEYAALEAGAGVVIVARSRRGALVSFGTVRARRVLTDDPAAAVPLPQRVEFEAALDGRVEGAQSRI
jgi:hypothetical protein